MNVNFNEARGLLELEDCRIIYRNFSGTEGKFNREGDRSFSIVISDQKIADELIAMGWNVKIKAPREEGEEPFMTLKVKVKFNGRGPSVYVISDDAKPKRLSEETIGILDEIDIQSVNMDLRAYDWDINGKLGRTAYLQAIEVIQNVDRFSAKYSAEDLFEEPKAERNRPDVNYF